MAFILFDSGTRRSSLPKASISSRGMIALTQKAVNKFNLKNYKLCMLHYDPSEQKIGITLTNDENNTSTLTLREKISGAEITSKIFFRHFNISISGRIVCDVEATDEKEFLIIDLKKGLVKSKHGKV